MTPKHGRFCQEYLVDLNATEAAKRAGYSPKTAYAQGHRLLKNVEIQARIAELQAERAGRVQVTADEVLRELARIGFSDMRQFTSWGPQGVDLLASGELPEDAARCVAEVSQVVGEKTSSVRFKLHDKVAALTLIGKHLGMFKEVIETTEKPYREAIEEARRDLRLVS